MPRLKGSRNCQYKIRLTCPKNQQGISVYGITVPNIFAEKFKGTKFTIEINENSIIYTSGCDLKDNVQSTQYFDKFTTKKKRVYNV